MNRDGSELRLEGKVVLTTFETASILRISERSVREAIKTGALPHLRLGRRLLVPVPALIALLGGHSTEEPPGT